MVRAKEFDPGGIWAALHEPSTARGAGELNAAEEVAMRVQEHIISEGLLEGQRLPSERDLAALFNTSRPTVSQAIRALVVKGLVESRRGSGAYVTRRPELSLTASVDLMLNLNIDSAHHLNDLRLWLETTGVARAIEFGTDEEFEAGAVALERLHESTGDTAALMSADNRFHATLVRASQNPYLASIFESVHAVVIEYEYQTWIDRNVVPNWLRPEHTGEIMELHEPILDAVRHRDPEAAKIAVLRHHDVMSEHIGISHPVRAPS